MRSLRQSTETADAAGPSRGERGTTSRPREATDTLGILRIATDLYPEVTGGGAIHAHAMSKRQAEQGHDVTVVTSDHGDRGRPVVESRSGYTVVRNRQLGRPFGNSIVPGTLASLYRRLPDADVVHAHSHLYFSSNVAAAVARFSDAPLVVTNHGLASQTAPTWVHKLFIPTVGRFTFNAADRILCYTDTDRRRLRERGVHTPIEVIQNGIDCQQFAPDGGPDEPQLLFVGRLTDAKGVPTLLSAFDSLASTYPAIRLRIVGDGPARSRYERRCRDLGIGDRVTFAGDVPYDAMPGEYVESFAFVLPSHNEGLPRTVLEAMACETPVVTSALPQLEPVVRGAGYTVERGSPGPLAEAVGTLYEDDDRRREFGRTGRQRVLEDHVWRQTVDETTGVLADLVAEAT